MYNGWFGFKKPTKNSKREFVMLSAKDQDDILASYKATLIDRVKKVTNRISMSILGMLFSIRVEHDNEYENGRVFLQVIYNAPCTKTGKVSEWHGRKFYLSKYMTDDEIVKTAYVAFEAAVKHEVMEGFKVDRITLFNPHINFEELLAISHREIQRDNNDH